MERELEILRRFVRPRTAAERCELCAADLYDGHPHLIEPAGRQIVCACDPCSMLFTSREGARYKRIPRDSTFLSDLRLNDEQWDALTLPIQLAFFFYSSHERRLIALYPSPAGATESTLSLEAWADIAAKNPVLLDMQPDIEALLVNRVGERREYFIAPIDKCFELVGIIRMKWKGLSGGTENRKAIEGFFEEMRQHSRKLREAA